MTTTPNFLFTLFSDAMITQLSDWLLKKDSDFPPIQAAYQDATNILIEQLGTEAKTFLSARDQQILSDLRYSAYLGFQANLTNFRSPVGNHFLTQGPDHFLREHIKCSLPSHTSCETAIFTFLDKHGQTARAQIDAIQNYYIYLETVGPKLSHYWGYLFANQFLPMVEPGYVCDGAQTSIYTMELRREFGFPVT